MKTRHLCVSLVFFGAAMAALAIAHTLPASAPVHERTFDITYVAEVHDVPGERKMCRSGCRIRRVTSTRRF